MKQCFIHVVGHNASGKTTLAKRLEEDLNLSRITGDEFKVFVKDHIRYFKDLDLSYPSDIGVQLRPLTISYRLQLARILLEAGESVVFDGSGLKKADRKPLQKLLAAFPNLTRVIIHTTISEDELLQRLEIRGQRWKDMYQDLRKTAYEPPTPHEADLTLEYNQHNYDEIYQQLKLLLNRY